jgi:hypothetical protein
LRWGEQAQEGRYLWRSRCAQKMVAALSAR